MLLWSQKYYIIPDVDELYIPGTFYNSTESILVIFQGPHVCTSFPSIFKIGRLEHSEKFQISALCLHRRSLNWSRISQTFWLCGSAGDGERTAEAARQAWEHMQLDLSERHACLPATHTNGNHVYSLTCWSHESLQPSCK